MYTSCMCNTQIYSDILTLMDHVLVHHICFHHHLDGILFVGLVFLVAQEHLAAKYGDNVIFLCSCMLHVNSEIHMIPVQQCF